MAIKNFWAFNPGETIFAEKLYQKYKNHIDLYFPIKDSGIDLLAVSKDKRHILSFQIKESRYYEDEDCAWHQENIKNFTKNKDKVDFYVFVIYLPGHLVNAKRKSRFEIKFVIVPTKELWRRIQRKKPNKNGTYNFYFRFRDDGTLQEVREKKSVIQDNSLNFDYTKYLNAWSLIHEAYEA